MRGIVGRLCHGRERGALEPLSVVPPALRLAAWVLVLVASLAGLGFVVAAATGSETAVVATGAVAFTAAVAAAVVRYVAGGTRPFPLTLTVREPS